MIELINFLGQYLCFFILHICGNGSFPKPLSEKEEHEYLVRSAKGDIEARNILVEHNLRLVVYIAKKFDNTGVGVEDLISIGTIGLIKAIDKERMELCSIYHVDTPNVEDSFARMYSYEGDLYDMLRNAECYKGIKGPKSLKVRYLLEDIPYNLRSLQALGQIAKIKTPVIDAVCTLGETLVGGDMDEGYTLKTLGLSEDMTVDEFLKLVNG